MILLAILSRFVLVVDSMYTNRVDIYANCQRLLLFDKERPTLEFEQTLKNFCCLLNLENNMVQIYEQVVSDIENKDTHCNFLALAMAAKL